jgi:hypothetical protein
VEIKPSLGRAALALTFLPSWTGSTLEDVGAIEAPSITSSRYFDFLAFLAGAFLADFVAAFAFLGAAFLAAVFDFLAGIAMGTPLR